MFLLSGSMHLSLEVLLTVGADEEISLTETERIRLLADYIQETERNEIKRKETKRRYISFRFDRFRFVSFGFVSFRFDFVSHFTDILRLSVLSYITKCVFLNFPRMLNLKQWEKKGDQNVQT
jgi:hypothetical protein